MVAVDDSFYKIMSEALLVLTLIVKTIRPLGMYTYVHHWVLTFRTTLQLVLRTVLYIFFFHSPPLPSPKDGSTMFDFHPYVQSIYSSALKRLRAADIDQEVKERAITCM